MKFNFNLSNTVIVNNDSVEIYPFNKEEKTTPTIVFKTDELQTIVSLEVDGFFGLYFILEQGNVGHLIFLKNNDSEKQLSNLTDMLKKNIGIKKFKKKSNKFMNTNDSKIILERIAVHAKSEISKLLNLQNLNSKTS